MMKINNMMKGFGSNWTSRKPVKYEMTQIYAISSWKRFIKLWFGGQCCVYFVVFNGGCCYVVQMIISSVVLFWRLSSHLDCEISWSDRWAAPSVRRRQKHRASSGAYCCADQHNNSCKPVTGTQLNTRDLHFAAKRRARRPRSPVLVTCPARALPHSPIV